jgi:hypothetical protein
MSLASNNINHTNVCGELGISVGTNRQQRDLCAHVNAGHLFSFYGPGGYTVDVNKTAVWVAPTSDYKLGDFRLYNRTASTPSGGIANTQYWGPSGSTTTLDMVSFPQQMNLLAVNSGASYLTYKAYTDSARTILWSGGTRTVAWSGFTPALYNNGHTRNQSSQIDGTHIDTWPSFSTVGATNPDYIYMDVYASDASGNRLVNLGTSVSGGYYTLTLRQNVVPQINQSGNCVSRTGYTGTFTAINTSSTECGQNAVTQSVGSSAWSFYLTAVGIQMGSWNIYPTSCTVVLYHYASGGTLREAKTLGTTISLNSTTAKQLASTTYGNLSNTWNYNDYGVVSITAVNTWGTAGSC